MLDDESVFDTSSVRNIVEGPGDPEMPDQLSPEWPEYVKSKFFNSELIEINGNRYPNCYGLRRITKLLMGDIVQSKPTNVQYITSSPPRAVVEYSVVVEKHDGGLVEIGDVASVSAMNTDDLFLGYAEETAATRAEGRCLRKLLMLNCVAAEELTRNKDVAKEVRQVMNTAPTDGSYDAGGKITPNQLSLLLNKCNQLSIDELKFVNTKQQYLSSPNAQAVTLCGSRVFPTVNDVSKKEAIDMIKLLTNYQNNSQPIPKEIQIDHLIY